MGWGDRKEKKMTTTAFYETSVQPTFEDVIVIDDNDVVIVIEDNDIVTVIEDEDVDQFVDDECFVVDGVHATEVAPMAPVMASVVAEMAPVMSGVAPMAPVVSEMAPVVSEVAPVVSEVAPVVPMVSEMAPVVPMVSEMAPMAPVVSEVAPVMSDETPATEGIGAAEMMGARIDRIMTRNEMEASIEREIETCLEIRSRICSEVNYGATRTGNYVKTFPLLAMYDTIATCNIPLPCNVETDGDDLSKCSDDDDADDQTEYRSHEPPVDQLRKRLMSRRVVTAFETIIGSVYSHANRCVIWVGLLGWDWGWGQRDMCETDTVVFIFICVMARTC